MTNSQPLSDEALLSIINALPIGMLLVNSSGEVSLSNPKAEDVFGYNSTELSGISIDQLVPEKLRGFHDKMRKDFINIPSPRAMDYGRILPARTKDGKEIQVQLGLTPLKLNNENHVLVSIIDISSQILKVASYHDALTGLANRNLFKELSNNLRNLAIRNNTGLSLLFLDLDGFKNVNDQYGHATGDMVLCEVADILNKSVRKNDIASRIGGDEFVMCFYGIEDITHLQTLANGLIKKISSIREINGNKINISASIGTINTMKPENLSLEDMIKDADKLMYAAKKAGKGQVITEKRL